MLWTRCSCSILHRWCAVLAAAFWNSVGNRNAVFPTFIPPLTSISHPATSSVFGLSGAVCSWLVPEDLYLPDIPHWCLKCNRFPFYAVLPTCQVFSLFLFHSWSWAGLGYLLFGRCFKVLFDLVIGFDESVRFGSLKHYQGHLSLVFWNAKLSPYLQTLKNPHVSYVVYVQPSSSNVACARYIKCSTWYSRSNKVMVLESIFSQAAHKSLFIGLLNPLAGCSDYLEYFSSNA